MRFHNASHLLCFMQLSAPGQEQERIFAEGYKLNANQELKTLKTMAAAMLANTWNKSPVLERTKEPVWIWNLTLIPTELTHPSKIVQSQAQILENRQKSA